MVTAEVISTELNLFFMFETEADKNILILIIILRNTQWTLERDINY